MDGRGQTLDDAQDAYNDAANTVKELEIKVEQAQRNDTNSIETAQEDLDDAKQDLDWALRGPDAIEAALAQAEEVLAQAKLAEAEDTYVKVKDGPDPDQLALAEARVTTAQSNVDYAKQTLDSMTLNAPFNGAVVTIDLAVGETVSPNRPVILLADFSKWYVETNDLDELKVVGLEVGEASLITVDALPGLTLTGTVERVGLGYTEKSGDVLYTARVRLDETDASLRWGMTAQVQLAP